MGAEKSSPMKYPNFVIKIVVSAWLRFGINVGFANRYTGFSTSPIFGSSSRLGLVPTKQNVNLYFGGFWKNDRSICQNRTQSFSFFQCGEAAV